jgi:Mlc titration factor MtfA (ptsG expression regulator)
MAVAQPAGAGAGLAAGLAVALVVAFASVRRPLRRLRAASRELTQGQRRWLRRHVPFYARANDDAQQHFERDVRIALAELRFEGAGGVEVTDELRLSVAAGVALLLHGRPEWELPRGRTILFYEGPFDSAYDVDDRPEFDGMVHPQGPVILSAPAVRSGWARADGYNVVLHELAHLFDFQASGADGIPSLLDPASAAAWMQLVREEMRRAKAGRGMLSGYAGTAPAELFAVATEQFFERPARPGGTTRSCSMLWWPSTTWTPHPPATKTSGRRRRGRV